jgi:dipeptidyl aminopeptidase/acylaminoacyl peptidase
LRIFALRGYLVLIPNYRGTATFGRAFLAPRDIGQVPADDILAGISSLVNKGIIDTGRIGIVGQSHGGWLGPYVITKKKIFRVAEFAEGSVDLFSNYSQMPGWLDLNVHEAYFGSPYDNPQRYIELSPIFHFAGLHTATLMEYGKESLSAAGLELLTAYWRYGIPNEFIIYPKTGHNIASPVLQLESMHRNLDWLDYWMYGTQDPDPAKQTEYDRWKKMTLDMEKIRAWTRATPPH